MDDELRISVESEGATTRVRLGGEIDLQTAPALRECLDELDGTVIVDLAGVTFLDSSGLGAFVAVRKRLLGNAGALWLRGPRPHVRRAIEVTGLAVLLDPPDANQNGHATMG